MKKKELQAKFLHLISQYQKEEKAEDFNALVKEESEQFLEWLKLVLHCKFDSNDIILEPALNELTELLSYRKKLTKHTKVTATPKGHQKNTAANRIVAKLEDEILQIRTEKQDRVLLGGNKKKRKTKSRGTQIDINAKLQYAIDFYKGMCDSLKEGFTLREIIVEAADCETQEDSRDDASIIPVKATIESDGGDGKDTIRDFAPEEMLNPPTSDKEYKTPPNTDEEKEPCKENFLERGSEEKKVSTESVLSAEELTKATLNNSHNKIIFTATESTSSLPPDMVQMNPISDNELGESNKKISESVLNEPFFTTEALPKTLVELVDAMSKMKENEWLPYLEKYSFDIYSALILQDKKEIKALTVDDFPKSFQNENFYPTVVCLYGFYHLNPSNNEKNQYEFLWSGKHKSISASVMALFPAPFENCTQAEKQEAVKFVLEQAAAKALTVRIGANTIHERALHNGTLGDITLLIEQLGASLLLQPNKALSC
jgi:hypothetical protein